MSMVCPQCKGCYEQRLVCPECATRLVFVENAARPSRPSFAAGGWQQTPWGRILIGLLLAQGLYYALRHLCVAGLLASDAIDRDVLWGSLYGQLLLQALQLVSLCVGGVFAGAAQRYGVVYGAVLGVWNGAFLVLVRPAFAPTGDAELYNAVTMYGQPLLQAGVGCLAGWLGSCIWHPLTPAAGPEGVKKPKPKTRRKVNPLAGSLSWARVGMGAALAVGGTLWADVVLDQVVRASSYQLTPGSTFQAQLITWEITALAMLAGGALAGATTFNGVKQGLAVGFASSAILVAIRAASPVPPSFFGLALNALAPILLGPIGGAFGCKLLPPLLPVRRRSLEGL